MLVFAAMERPKYENETNYLRQYNETNYLRQYMAQLRRKLKDDPSHLRHLLTEPDMDYRLHLNDGGQPAEI